MSICKCKFCGAYPGLPGLLVLAAILRPKIIFFLCILFLRRGILLVFVIFLSFWILFFNEVFEFRFFFKRNKNADAKV